MGLNVDHIRSINGALKLVSIVLGIIAGSLGVSSYYTSANNRDCHGLSNSFPSSTTTLPPLIPSSSTTDLPTSSNAVSELEFQSDSTDSTDRTTSSSLPSSTIGIEEWGDMAPILWMETFSFSVVWIGLIISIVLFALSLLMDQLEYSKFFKAGNFVFYFIWTVLLIIASVFVAYATHRIDQQICQTREFGEGEKCQNKQLKLAAAAFDFLMGVTYAALAWRILGTKLYEEV